MPQRLPNQVPSDSELLKLFQTEPERAWSLFIEKQADFIFGLLRRAGFDYDEAMNRFIYICEKLSEQNFRRLRTIQYAGQHGDITPWLRQVVKRLCINWAWSEEGRKRLFKPVAEMPAREQRIFELYFWRGQTPCEIYETLRLEHETNIELGDVFDALENIFAHLSQKKLWKLMSGLLRMRQTLSLDEADEETGLQLMLIDAGPTPEDALRRKEENQLLAQAMEKLCAREKLVMQLHYEDAMTSVEIATVLRLEEREVKNLLKSSLYKLRKALC
jgi:RNA polymerase sigma factor (sigma-70 family)